MMDNALFSTPFP